MTLNVAVISAGATGGADRRRGFIAAIQRHGLASDQLIGAGRSPSSMREGADAMGRLLDTMPDTQAVICVSALSAFGALTKCQRHGTQPTQFTHPRGSAISHINALAIHESQLARKDQGTLKSNGCVRNAAFDR
jgi:hypothetical protein